MESFRNWMWPSAIRTLTPPGWKLSELLNRDAEPEPVWLQYVHSSDSPLGTTTVLNSVMAIDPCIQESPRWMSGALPEFQAALHAWIPASTPVGLLKTLDWMAVAGSVTSVNPSR